MTRERKFYLIAAVAALFSLSMVSAAQAVLIDDFNDGSGVVQAGAAGSDTDTEGGLGSISGDRQMDIPDPSGSAISGIGNLTMAANPAVSGVLSFSLDAGTSGSGKLTWDGLGGVDLTDGGASNSFSLNIISIDQGDVDLSFMIEDSGANTSSVTAPNLGAGAVNIPFVDLVGTADLTDIESIMFSIEGVDGSDLILDFVETSGGQNVPEPASIAIWSLLALAGAGYALRRRVKQS